MFPRIVVVWDVLFTHQMKHAPSQKCSRSVFEPPPSSIYEVEKHGGGGVMLHELEMFEAAVAIAFVTRANTILQIIGFLRLSLFLLLRLFRDKRRLWGHSQMMSVVRGEGRLTKYRPKEGRLRYFGTDKGSGVKI